MVSRVVSQNKITTSVSHGLADVVRGLVCSIAAIASVTALGGAEPRCRPRVLLSLLLCFLWPGSGAAGKDPEETLTFNRHIRPILSDTCFQCHGPDANTRMADLRLDLEEPVRSDRGGYRVLVPGSPTESELYRRLTSTEELRRMPPPYSPKQISPGQIELIRRWIEQGGQYERHWSFIPPERPGLPDVGRTDWPRNPIDHFVLARLESEGLGSSPEADRGILLRRVTLDLTGLPPTPKELDNYLADASPDAYLRVVNRLLDSQSFGEHLARYWLDAARFADTNGFFRDSERSMWRWRDWVIDAFNRNMPFDQFTVEQLAGDLLPNPTNHQRIATGFGRNHMTTMETGVIDEEYRIHYVVDRLETTSTLWLGLTTGCARCHDHKFDPISQKEFYRLMAFFNNVPEKGTKTKFGNSPPILQVPDEAFTARLEKLRRQAEVAGQEFAKIEPQLKTAQSSWEQTAKDDLPEPPSDGLVAHFPMDGPEGDAGAATFTPGLLGGAVQLEGDSAIEVGADLNFDRSDAFSFGAWVKPTKGGPSCVLSKNDDVKGLRGFDLMLRKGKAVVHLVHEWNTDAIQVTTSASVPRKQWHHILVTYDGSSKASGVRIYLNGKAQTLKIGHDSLTGTIRTQQPLRIGRRSTSAAFTGLIDDVRVYDRALTAGEANRLVTHQLVGALVELPVDKRSSEQQKKLRGHFLTTSAGRPFRAVHDKAVQLRAQLEELEDKVPTTMVMQEMPEPRETHLLVRGQYDAPGEKVTAGVPAALPPLPPGAPVNRLGFARWLFDPSHPLTARVTVNRFWQQYFGTGIVETVEDFGAQGAWPSHPDLFDWLAVEFIESGWDVKHLQRLIVTSATYRQSSIAATPLLERDPENRLLARGPRFRLDAEVVRDNALAISGLLAKQVGGPSVKPYQPQGLWEVVSYDGELSYPQDHGAALYRRSLYTFWKRQSPPPSMLAFDAPTRETCTVRRPRTNTPLQALAMLNDITYVEASRALAQRMMNQATSPEARIHFGFRLATTRPPLPEEVEILLDVFHQQRAKYEANGKAAERLLGVGESARDPSLDTPAHAAWTTVASTILNLDETVTKH